MDNCKLINADCLEAMRDIPDGSVDMVMTDPPYGTTACKWDSVIPFEPMWEQLKRITKKNGAIVLTASQPFTSALIMSNVQMFKYCWVWKKNRATGHLNAKKSPMRAHEDIIVFGSAAGVYNAQMILGSPYKWDSKRTQNGCYGHHANDKPTVNYGSRYPLSVVNFSAERGLHPTQKPVALMEYLIRTYTNEGETVLDFTMGSGTTGVACKNLNRSFTGIEMDADYFAAASKRIAGTPEPECANG
jgi:site-specific DNA-methyltransferase (adenine-specific)